MSDYRKFLFQRTELICAHVQTLSLKEKRKLFCLMRCKTEIDETYIFPDIGLTVGEFCTSQVLTSNLSRDKK